MGRWLDRVASSGGCVGFVSTPTEAIPEENHAGEGYVSFVGTVSRGIEQIHPASALEWLAWITERCPLLPDDIHYVRRRLGRLPPLAMEKAALRYAQAWADAAEAEPRPHRKDNAGRRAANRTLLAPTH